MNNLLIKACAVSLLTSCGGGGGSGGEETFEATVTDNITLSIAEEVDLPACNDVNNQQLIYLETVEEFRKCSDETWVTITFGDDSPTSVAAPLVTVTADDTGLCSNGGKVIKTGVDSDNNTILDANEVVTTTEVCNGVDGVAGANGSNGTNGADGTNGAGGTNGTNGANGIAGAAGTSYGDGTHDIYSEYRRSIFRIEVVVAGVGSFYGTGFRCEEEYICTAYHLIKDRIGSTVKLTTVSPIFDINNVSEISTVPTVKYDSSKDLAKIHLAKEFFTSDAKIVPISSSMYNETLTPTLVLSYPMSLMDLHVDLGSVVSNYVGTCFDGLWTVECLANKYKFTTSNDTSSGSSGAPIFNTETKEVIGMVQGGPTTAVKSNWTWTTHAAYLLDF